MSFWDEHAKSEAEHEAAERAKLPPSAQNGPATCADCGVTSTDVLLGVCGDCFTSWEASRV